MAPNKSAKVEPDNIVENNTSSPSDRRRSSEVREGSSGGSDTTTTGTKAPAKLRSVDFLTPEQLRRKREGDRLSQKHARQRTKVLVEHLQARVQDLELQNSSLAHDLSAATAALAGCRCGRAQHQHQITSANDDKDGSWQSDLGSETSSSTALSRTMRLDDTGSNGNALEATLTQMIDGNFPGLDFTMWGGVSGFDDKTAAAAFHPGLFTVPYTNGLSTGPVTAPTLPQQPPQQRLPSPSPTNDAQLVHTATHGHAHAYHTIARGQHVWSTLPPHLAATCLLDEVVINLLQSRRPLESSGGNAQEFQRCTFPSVQSLLNPALSLTSSLDEAEAASSSSSTASSPASTVGPVTNTIVNKIIHVMTVPTLPEQIAILYVMSAVVRWLISPTESNYDSMPEWLRPTPSQLVEPHPPWIDLFVWPRGRERLCRQPRLHNQHALMSRLCNETISINWPHHPSDMILQTNGTEYVLNPIFDRHIKNIENWTVGKRVLQAFPEFANDMNFR
ncbi:hypothetical protein Sste5346_006135 [Sporothrix stenoceras]|uniref:BZIP domain-containing protein n=1 Tax=Sporothrix stenoceras TaxID=5173 RepID=A0ABR3Z041_9PEZI